MSSGGGGGYFEPIEGGGNLNFCVKFYKKYTAELSL